MTRLNNWLADKLAGILSSMWTFWVLVAMIWGSLALQVPTNGQGWLQFLVQSFFQGVALPVLAFVAKKEGTAMQQKVDETHDVAMAEHTETQEILADVRELVQQIHEKVS